MKTTNKLTSIVSNFTLLFVLMLIITACNSSNKIAESSERTKTNINNNWLYLENDTEQISEAIENKDWQQINLPHSWNSLDATDLDPGYRRSGSWYKKTIDVNINANSIYELYFEGVNITSKIFVNGTKVGTHIGGYN